MPDVDLGTGLRDFGTGATRDKDDTKLNYARCLSMPVLERFLTYMNEHRKTADPTKLRDWGNWKLGIPRDAYLESLWRHLKDITAEMHGEGHSSDGPENAVCAIPFNASGLLHEILLGRDVGRDDRQK